MTLRRHGAVCAGWVLIVALAGCGGSSSTTTPTATPPQSASCGHNTIFISGSPVPTETSTDSPAADVPDAEFPQDQIPDGSWSGPILAAVTGQPVAASGSVYSPGGGTIQLVMRDHAVQSGTATFNATSSGTVVTASGGQGQIQGALSMADGVVTGSSSAVQIAGTAVLSGSIAVTVHGTTTTAPLTGSVPMTATLTVTRVRCDKVRATFIPDLNAKTGGRAVFSGTAEWRGQLQP